MPKTKVVGFFVRPNLPLVCLISVLSQIKNGYITLHNMFNNIALSLHLTVLYKSSGGRLWAHCCFASGLTGEVVINICIKSYVLSNGRFKTATNR